MRAIPRQLLIHSAELRKEKKGDWGSDGTEPLASLSHVRIEPSSKVIRDKNNREIQLAATLIYDCRNSRPKDQEFAEDQIIDFQGALHRIVSVEPLYDGKKLHHYEMGMIRYADKSDSENPERYRPGPYQSRWR